MKLPPGTRTIIVTVNGQATITTMVPPAQSPLKMGTMVYEWDEAKGVYWSNIGPSWIDPLADGTFSGASGVTPNVMAFLGTWS